MRPRPLLVLILLAASSLGAGAQPIDASLHVDAARKGPHAIPRFLTGKFAEHLGSNISNGMDAQVLRNPTFGDWPFVTGGQTPDGRHRYQADEAAIAGEIRRQARRQRWPDEQVDRLVESRPDALAHWWVKVGARRSVRTSPDTGPHGGRAQRVEVAEAGQGIAQWTHLPLHRERRYTFRIVVRSPDLDALTLNVTPRGVDAPVASAVVEGISAKWGTYRGRLTLPASAPADAIYRVALTAGRPGQFVVGRVLLYPADHVNGADPDVVRLLKESRLPLLRWPGGNFVSGYDWRDGVGPVDERPTRANPAWGIIEPNLFGTDEFIAFCRAVGAEPMICVNAGDGTPAQAAAWIEYCNGPATSPMGRLRAANGHPAPYRVKLWEAGNELWGAWQVHWTTPRGNVDRWREFSAAMLAADPSITLYACGAPVLWGAEWNRALIAGGGPRFARTTDHPLIGGNVPVSVDPLDVYRDFMAVPDLLEGRWRELERWMREGGAREPRLGITELQIFAHLGPAAGPGQEVRLTRGNLVTPGTHAEALYDTLIYHAAVRLLPFVDLVTQSATVNHGGGLRKELERVYPNPCHHAQAAFAALGGATPLAIRIDAPTERAPVVLPDIRNAARGGLSYPVVSAVAAQAADGAVLLSIVNRGTSGPVRLKVTMAGFRPGGRAEVWSLAADVPWAANTLERPDHVSPSTTDVAVATDGTMTLEIPRYAVLRVRIPPAR